MEYNIGKSSYFVNSRLWFQSGIYLEAARLMLIENSKEDMCMLKFNFIIAPLGSNQMLEAHERKTGNIYWPLNIPSWQNKAQIYTLRHRSLFLGHLELLSFVWRYPMQWETSWPSWSCWPQWAFDKECCSCVGVRLWRGNAQAEERSQARI